MKTANKKVIGIDVCKNSVRIVRLERVGSQIFLTDSRQIPLENNTPDNGIDSRLLAAAIKNLKLTKMLEHCDAAVCLGSTPDLLQILKLPDSPPHNIIKYIQDEIHQYAVLPLKNVKTDYCTLRPAAGDTSKYVLVGACQTQPLVDMVRDIEKHRIDTAMIEPAVISLIRACWKNTISTSSEKNTMLVLQRDNIFNICVFSGQKLDFLRTKKIELDNKNPLANAVAAQIKSVLQFYAIEKNQPQKAWQIFLTCDSSVSNSNEVVEQLRNTVNGNIEINPLRPENFNLVLKSEQYADFSPVAAGAAMKLLNADDSDICINILPDEISEIRKSNKNLLIIVNVAAVILLCLFLHIAQLSIKTADANAEIAKRTETKSVASISRLSKVKTDANEQTRLITKNICSIEKVMPGSNAYNWAIIIAEASRKLPQTVQISSLRADTDHSLIIEGTAVNYAALNDFISRLSECKTIASTRLEDTKQNTVYGEGFIDYTLNCSLVSKE